MPRLQRALLYSFTVAIAFACGEKFTAVDSPTAGSSGGGAGHEADGGADSDMNDGGRAGKASVAGTGGSGAGRAGAPSGGRPGTSAEGGEGGEGGAGGAPVEASPVPTEGLQIWLRADEGVIATPLTGAVTSWQDSSGNHRDAGQIALNYQPTLLPAGLAGKAAVVFDGVDDFLKLGALDVDFSAGVSIFIAMQQESTGNCDGYFEASTDSEQNDLHFGDWMDSFNYEVLEDVVQDTQYPVVLHQPQIAVAVQSATGWVQLRRNGNGAGERKSHLPERVERTQVFIGKTLYGNCSFLDGSVGELLLYNRGMADAELLAVEQYLRTKWDCCRE